MRQVLNLAKKLVGRVSRDRRNETFRQQIQNQLTHPNHRTADVFKGMETLEPRLLMAADVVLSEFSALNVSVIQDEDTDYSDWIELENKGDAPQDLTGWHLTNSNANPNMWTLPAVTLNPGEFMVIFASAKDRTNPASELHTNFEIDHTGGYLALTNDSSTVVTEYDDYGQLGPDESLGIHAVSTDGIFIDGTTDVDVLVPADDALGTTWTGVGFDSSGWTQGTGSVGFNTGSTPTTFTTTFYKSTVAINNLAQADNLIAGINQSSSAVVTPNVLNFNDGGGGVFGAGDVAGPITGDDYAAQSTATFIITPDQAGVWTFGVNNDDGARLIIDGNVIINDDVLAAPHTVLGTVNLSAGVHTLEHTFFERGGGASFELFASPGNKGAFDGTFRLVGDSGNGGIALGGLDQLIDTDIEGQMHNARPGAYARYEFNVTDTNDVTSLFLNTIFDDGMVAYLNGTQVNLNNAPVGANADSVADAENGLAASFVSLNGQLGLLQNGTNVLAIHGLNSSSADNDFLIAPSLTARVKAPGVVQTNLATPGSANGVQDPVITEFMARNDNTIDDEDGDSSDWIEIHNPGSSDLNLLGMHLTDDSGDLSKWTFPDVTLEAGEYLVVFASNKDRATPGSELHTNFALDGDGEYLALVAADGTTVLSEYMQGPANYPQQFEDVSYGLDEFDAVNTGSGGAAGLQAYWAFDEGAGASILDATGQYTASINGGTSWTLDRNGIPGQALDFNGFAGSTVTTDAFPVDLGVDGANAKTVSFWARADSFNNGGPMTMGTTGANGQDFSLRTTTNLNQFRAQYWGGADFDVTINGAGQGIGGQQVQAAQNNWVHFVLVYDGGLSQLYADGIVVGSEQNALNTANATPLSLGWWNTTPFDGAVDDLAVWNTALPYESIVGLYDGTYTPLDAPITFDSSALQAGITGGVNTMGVMEITGNGVINGISDAIASIASGAGLVQVGSVGTLNVNDPQSGGGGGYFGGDVPFLSNTPADDNDIALLARGTFTAPTSGMYTFGYFNDDGSYLNIHGANFESFTSPNPTFINGGELYTPLLGGANTALGVTYLEAGDYNYDFIYFERGGGAYTELFAAPGAHTSFDAEVFRLLGHQSTGDTPITSGEIVGGWNVDMIYDGANSITAAIQDIEDYWNSNIGTNVFSETGVETINYADPQGGGGGHFAPQLPFPGDTAAAENNFALGARALFRVATAGVYTFDVFGDDGSRLLLTTDLGAPVTGWTANSGTGITVLSNGFQVNGCCQDAYGQVFLAAGDYNIELIWNEIGGGAYVDLTAAYGNYTAFDENVFSLVGSNDPGVFTDIDGLQLTNPAPPINDDPVAPTTILNAPIVFHPTPTPGAPNSSGVETFVGDTTIDVPAGHYSAAMDVTISNETPGATIYYTLDGSKPTTSSLEYTGPLNISSTTTLRAAAFLDGAEPSEIVNRTYIYLADVITQPELTRGHWFTGMDATITQDPQFASQMEASLLSLDVVSITMPDGDIFGGNGIYNNPGGRGIAWEREASIEYIPMGGTGEDGFQIDAGLRITGAASRGTGNPKHSLRMLFKQQYGDSKLEYDVFGRDSAVERFDELQLRAGFNYSWNAGQGGFGSSIGRAQYLRDRFSNENMLAMEQPSVHGKYVHVYINGLYWGQHQLQERPEESFAASYLGGDKDDYDAINAGEVINGTGTAFNDLMNLAGAIQGDGTVTDAEVAQVEEVMNLDNLIDYMINIYYTGNRDAPVVIGNATNPRNYRMARNVNDGQWYVFAWDSEWTLEDNNVGLPGSLRDLTTISGVNNPAVVWSALKNNDNFRLRAADRAQELIAPGGVFSVEAATARYQAIADELELGIIAESARWARKANAATPPNLNNWIAERDRILNDYLPQRTDVLIQILINDNIFTAVTAPQFFINGGLSYGGRVTDGSILTMGTEGAPATILYTTDGSDPRLPDGNISGSAIQYNTQETFIDHNSTSKYYDLPGLGWEQIVHDDSYMQVGLAALGYDTGATETTNQFTHRYLDITNDIVNLGTAVQAINGTLAGMDVTSDRMGVFPTVNFGDAGSYAGEGPLLTTDREQYMIESTATIHIPDGTWTVAVSSDDGFRLQLPGITFSSKVNENTTGYAPGAGELVYGAPRGYSHTLGTFTVATGSGINVPANLLFYERGGGDVVEFTVASGSFATFDPNFFNLVQDGESGWSVSTQEPTVDYNGAFNTNIRGLALDFQSSSLVARIPFTPVGNINDIDTLAMNIQYDDGFIVYLNGVEVASANSPGGAPSSHHNDTIATTTRPDADALTTVTFDLTAQAGLLVSGTNLLAVRMLNSDNPLIDPDMLFTVELEANYAGGEIVLNDSTLVKARALSAGTWSPLQSSLFLVGETTLAITEINYNPHDPSAAEELLGFTSADDFEFIELMNNGLNTITLNGVEIVDGVEFDFTGSAITELAPGERVLVVEDIAAFEARYGTGLPVAGQWTGGLGNGGETIEVIDGVGDQVVLFDYSDGGLFPSRADGIGSSLELTDVNLLPAVADQGLRTDFMNDGSNWRASYELHGTPGTAGQGLTFGVLINEVLAHTDLPQVDSIELLNTTGAPIDISGWWISDSFNRFEKFQIADSTIINSGEYMVFDESHFNPTPPTPGPNDFGLSASNGDDVWLMTGTIGNSVADGFVDHVEFGASLNGESFGRLPNGDMYPLQTPTFGAANADPRVGPVIISEIMYAPLDPGVSGVTANDMQFVEIYNPSDTITEDLTNWGINGLGFDFPASTMLAPGETLVIVPFNPATDLEQLNTFRSVYGIDASVELIGPFTGQIDNSGEKLTLERADESPIDDPQTIPLVIEDQADYDDESPWPTSPAVGADALHRVAADSYGNDPASWVAATPTPGSVALEVCDPGDFDCDGDIDADDIDMLRDAINAGSSDPKFDVNNDNVLDDADFAFQIEDILDTAFGDANLDKKVNIQDLSLLASRFNQSAGWAGGNFNLDNIINIQDLALLASRFNFDNSGGAAASSSLLDDAGQTDALGESTGAIVLDSSSDDGDDDGSSWSHIDSILVDEEA